MIQNDDIIDIYDMEVDYDQDPLFEMAKVVNAVVAIDQFDEIWSKLTNGKNIGKLKDYLIEHNETNNPVIKEDRYKKYKELSQCRKLRWNSRSNKASQTGDIRIINSYIPSREKIYLIFCYPKSKQEDLNLSQVKMICNIVKDLNETPEEE